MSLVESIIRACPWFLRGPVGGRLFESLGTLADELVERQVIGLDQGNPLYCDESALGPIGASRRMRRYPTESTLSYRIRLSQWRQRAKMLGSHQGELRELQYYFSPSRPMVRAVHQSGDGAIATWHTVDEDGAYSVHRQSPSNWDWDSTYSPSDPISTAQWGRFWIIVYSSGLAEFISAITYNSANAWNGGAVWGGYFTSTQYADMVSVIDDTKAAHSRLWGLIIATDPDSFDPTGSGAGYPDGTWGYAADPITGLPTRLSSAIYAYNLGQG